MFKTILKTLALSATLTLLSACGASEFLRCSGFILGEEPLDRPSCDSFTGGGAYELSGFKEQTIGGPIVDEKGTAIYDGIFGLYGSDTKGGGVQLIVDFDAREISNNDIYNDYAVINGEFTERGVLTGKFNIENDGTAPADINGLIGYDGVWATFDNRSETADGYLGGFMATRLPEYYPEPDVGCYYCASLAESLERAKQKARRLELAHIADLALIGRPAHLEGEESRLAEEAYRAEILRINGEEYVSENVKLDAPGYDATAEAYLAETLRIEREEIFTKNADLGDLYHLGGEGYRAAAEAYLAELSRVIEEEGYNAKLARPEDNPELTRLDERRAEEYELDRERRIQAEFKEDTSAFNTTSAQVASTRVAGTYYGEGEYYSYIPDIKDLTRKNTQDTFGIKKDEGEEQVLIMTINGVEYDLIPYIYEHNDAASSGVVDSYRSYYNDEENTGIYFIGNPNIQKIIRGTHATIQGDYIEYGKSLKHVIGADESQTQYSIDYTTGFATIGIQTDAAVVNSQSAVATYKGTGFLNTNSKKGRSYYWSTTIGITMNVDFDANTIAGTSHNKITFNSAPIVGNGFKGTFAFNRYANDTLFDLNGNPTGQYSGNFFGPNADDLAGVMSFDGTTYDYRTGRKIGVIGMGAFRADRQ